MTSSPAKTYRLKLLLLFSVLFPAAFFYIFTGYLHGIQNENRVISLTDKIEDDLRQLKIAQDFNSFWARKILQIFSTAKHPEELQKMLTAEFNKYLLKPRYVLFDNSGNMVFSNFSISNHADWNKAGKILRNYALNSDFVREFEEAVKENLISDIDFLAVRKVLGNLYFPRSIFLNSDKESPRLILCEFNSRANLVWTNFDLGKGFICFFDPTDLTAEKCVTTEIREKNLAYGQMVRFSRHRGQVNLSRKYEIFGRKMVLRAQLSHSSYAQAVADLDLIFPKDNLFHYRGLILITWLFFWITFYPVFSTRIKLDQLRIGIRNKFLLFFLISSILPAIPLSFFVRDYLHEFRETLIDSVSREGIKFLRYIDEQSILEKTQRIKMINDGIAELVPNLKQNGMQVGPLDSLRKILSPVSAALFVVASSSPRVFGKAGISCNGILEEKIAHEETRTEDYISQSNAVGWILRSVIANANGVSMEKKDQLKLEVFFETIGMSEPEVFIQKFYQDLEKIWEFGFGSFAYPCYVKFLSFSDKGKFDYGLLFAFDEPSLQEKYINGSYVDFNRNLGEYRLSAAHRLGRTWPENIMENPQFRTVFNSISPVNTSLNKLMSINGEEYLVQALQGNKSDFLKLVSLYPISRIDEQVNSKFRFLFWLWLASSLMSAGFSIFLARTISEPVKVLTKGVIAMGNRDFSQRLPDLGSDEFGHLGRVFNQTLADLEELQVAGFVQEKLLYQMEMPLKKGSVQIYGKTLSLNDLGGDYFDIVETENKTGILVGDVAGHGVAASLIMAFVKASVINNETLYDQPAVFLNRLNSLFRATRSKKQRKFMSFQYILFTQDGNFSYINAGHCFPILVDTKKQTTTFLKMINSPLGTTSKEFTEVQHHLLEPGQAVVLYSDGYYEAGDLGIEKFQELLLQSYSQDPQQFYSQFKTAFNQALKNPELNDDMTLVIITA